MTEQEKRERLKAQWKAEEENAHIHGWDFSHINDRYEEENDIPWDYEKVIRGYLTDDMKILDMDTGGGEFLLSLGHPYENTAATEGYPPNVEICRDTLVPLGIDLRECTDVSSLPFEDGSFDMIINRHGSFDPKEISRVLRKGGLFITQQVGCDNDRDLVISVLPDAPVPFPDMKLSVQKQAFAEAGFSILRGEEHYGAINFYDVGAFVWFAKIIEWEFPGFSVDRCFDKLLYMQRDIDVIGRVEGTTHRYLIVARKN